MKSMFAGIAMAAIALTGTVAIEAATAPADARVVVRIGVPAPGVYVYNGGHYRYRWHGGYYNYYNGGRYWRGRYHCRRGWCYR